jgi:hypothetical protein
LTIFAAIRRASIARGRALDQLLTVFSGPFFGFRVKMQPPTTIAIIAATKIPSCSCCIVVFSVARHHREHII